MYSARVPKVQARGHSDASAKSLSRTVGQAPSRAGSVLQASTRSDSLGVLRNAASEPGRPLNSQLQSSLAKGTGHDFGRVRVHEGSASARAADRMGARAYTLGRDIHLGSEVSSLSRDEQNQLLAHEAVHTVQQGSRTVQPHYGLTVSSPGDRAEVEARQAAQSLGSPSSHGDRGRTVELSQTVTPQVQRDLTGSRKVKDGEFALDLKTQSNAGAKSGLTGTIKFTPDSKAPDSTRISLLQTVRLIDLATNKDFVWTGDEANRNKAMTTANATKGVEKGRFVDALYAGITPRTAKADPAVSPYFIDPEGPVVGKNEDGSKDGATVKPASLWDCPGGEQNLKFSFETAAKSADARGYIYATLSWGFTISDAAKGTVDHEYANANRAPSASFEAAANKFNEFAKNPGASTAPTT
jgi:Domain of unknown function (DUF4157)